MPGLCARGDEIDGIILLTVKQHRRAGCPAAEEDSQQLPGLSALRSFAPPAHPTAHRTHRAVEWLVLSHFRPAPCFPLVVRNPLHLSSRNARCGSRCERHTCGLVAGVAVVTL